MQADKLDNSEKKDANRARIIAARNWGYPFPVLLGGLPVISGDREKFCKYCSRRRTKVSNFPRNLLMI